MMKHDKHFPSGPALALLIGIQALFSWLEAYLVSKISLIGKIGIALVHQEYKLLRSGWKTFILFFGLQLIVIVILAITQKKYPGKRFLLTALLLLLMALAGLWTTYMDFLHTYSHRLLKERFHLGFYLFWLGWMGTCVFFIVKSRGKTSRLLANWPEEEDTEEEMQSPS